MSPGDRVRGRWLDFIAWNNEDFTITVLIGGARYEYWLKDGCYAVAKEELNRRKRSQAQQLKWIKDHSFKYTAL